MGASILFILVCTVVGTQASHFRGGILSMVPVHPENKTMEITFRMSYRRNHVYAASCNQAVIDGGEEVGGHPGDQGFYCIEGCSSKQLVSLIRYVCTDFSTTENWEYGERTFRFSFPNATRIRLSATGCCWIHPFGKGAWDIFTSMDLSVRPDTGKINGSPQARFFPVIKIQQGCNSTIAIAPYDPDGDTVRCRWGNETTKECSGICNGFPNAVLDEQSCSLSYESKGSDGGFKAVAIMMEDFAVTDTEYSTPLSTVALNFLVNIYSSNLNCSSGVPQFIKPTPLNRACIAIPKGMTYDGQIIIDTQSLTAVVIEIKTVGPVGLNRTILTPIPLSTQTYMNISWLPRESDYFENNNNVESMCFTGVSSTGQSTEQRCISWMAGVVPPMVVSGSMKLKARKVNPINPVFELQFDQNVVRSFHPRAMMIKEIDSNRVVYKVIINSQRGLDSIQFLDGGRVTISTNVRLEEKKNFSVVLESGFVKGTLGCGPENEEYPSNDIWWIETIDITPPRITFTQAPRRSNRRIRFQWTENEPVHNVSCLVTTETRTVVERTDCSNNTWSGDGLEEGSYLLTILATDIAGNVGSRQFSWYVDLTPPKVIIETPFSGNMSNMKSVQFYFDCPGKPRCSYECIFGKGDNVAPVNCQQDFLLLNDINTEGQYELVVSATDDVGNKGRNFSFIWVADFTNPVISNIRTVSSNCDRDLSPGKLSMPLVTDNLDSNPKLTYRDQGSKGMCQIKRIWNAEDAAGNQMTSEQMIMLTYTPNIKFLEQLRLPCDPDETPSLPTETANTANICSRNVTLTYSDSVQTSTCPGQITRTWTARDSCDQSSPPVTETQLIVLYSICPPSACGRNNQPPNGTCLEGKCLCFAPWNGQDCDILIYKPVIKDPVQNEKLNEGQEYTKHVEIVQGTKPIYWELTQRVERLTINPQTGMMRWQAHKIGEIPISVRAKNGVGADTSSWNITIVPGYKTILNPPQQNTFSRATSVRLSGQVLFENGNIIESLSSGRVPVDVLVLFAGTTRKYRTLAKPDRSFEVLFEPLASEYGLYQAASKHPGVTMSQQMITWKALGMRLVKPVVSITDETISDIDKQYANVSKLVNDGPGTLTDIKVISISNVPSDVQVEMIFGTTGSIPVFEPGTEIPISIRIKADKAFDKVRAFFTLRSAESVVTTFILDVEIALSRPAFEVNPKTLNEVITKGSQKIVQFNITNLGRAVALESFVEVPRVKYLSVVKFGSSIYAEEKQSIGIGQSLLLVLQLSAATDSDIGRLEGAMEVVSTGANMRIPISLRIISDAKSTISFRIEDEFTYFKDGNPLVENAEIRVYNSLRGLTLTQTTKAGKGIAYFEDIPAETYEVNVGAPRHEGVKGVYTFTPGSSTIRIFLKRTAVTYRWTVTPTPVEDIYRIDIEADFETRVPMPVVTVTPTSIDLEPFELGLMNSFELNVTNHGLIRVERFAFVFPTNHPILEFKMVAGFNTLEARTFKIVPVRVVRKKGGRRKRAACGGYKVNIKFSYECGDWVLRNIQVSLITPVHKCQGGGRRGGGLDGGGGYRGGRGGHLRIGGGTPASGISACDPCLQSFINCLWSFTPFPSIGCITTGITIGVGEPTLKDYFEFIKCIASFSPGLVPKNLSILLSLLDCAKGIIPACLGPQPGQGLRKKRDVRNQLIVNYAVAVEPMNTLLEWKLEVFGKQVWLSVDEEAWMTAAFIPTVSDQSDEGQAITKQEFDTLTRTSPPVGVTQQDVIDFIKRWNNTVYDWIKGKTEPEENDANRMSYSKIKKYKQQIYKSNQEAVKAGYDSFVEMYNDRAHDINEVTDWEEEEGICAVVRVRIEQELALTREGFIAKLEIENGEISTLKKIDVSIKIKDAEDGQESTALFSIGNATLAGAIQADRSLAMQQNGELNWLMIPYSEAAPIDDKYYDVGGTLHYEVDGKLIAVPLFPARIKVMPDPLLYVHYFWEKFVVSDDPFTDRVESAIPFSLGVAVKNAGNGTAYNLRITSSQPEIIENEKGLLVNFKMIGASIGNMNITPSFSVNFGDVGPDKTVVASWWMISSLKGMFQNYSATFENENPLGDPRLSLLDELEVHELIHRVRIIRGEMDDEIDDFLVNEKIDYNVYPDAVFSSRTLERYAVQLQNISLTWSNNDGTSVTVSLEATPSYEGYVYYRFETLIPIPERVSLNSLSFTKTVNTPETLPPQNAWLTSMIGERDSDTIIGHIFDHVQDVGKKHEYKVIFSLMFEENTVTLKPTTPPEDVTLKPILTTMTTVTTVATVATVDTTVKTTSQAFRVISKDFVILLAIMSITVIV